MNTPLIDQSVREFSASLAARTPTPGGGSFGAAQVACGAALVTMACRFTSGEKFAALEAAMARRVELLEPLRLRALELVDLDSSAYDGVTSAYKLPKTNDAEKAARSAAIQAGLQRSLAVPLETIERATEGLRIAVDAVADVNANLLSDAASGALALWSGAEAALYNVRINAASISDKAWAAEKLSQAQAWAVEARTLLARVQERAATRLGT